MKYDGCEIVRTVRWSCGEGMVYDKVLASDGTLVMDKYVGTLREAMFAPEAVVRLKETKTEMRLVGQLNVEPLKAEGTDE